MAVGINIVTGFDGKGIEQAIKEFGKLETSSERAKFAIQKATLPAVAALGALTAAAGLSIKSAVEQQAQQQRLAQILLTTGKATQTQITALNAQAKALQQVGVVSEGNVTVLQSQLATFDLQASSIERLTPAIVDYVLAEKGATATAEDFKQMTNGLAQALNGQFGALTRVGFVLDDATKAQIANGTEAERSAALVKVLNSTYEGFNVSLRNTTAGSMQAFRNSLDDLRTNIGNALLPVFERIVSVLGVFADYGARNSKVVLALAGVVAIMSAAIVAASTAIKIHTTYQKLMEIEVLKNSRAMGMATTAAGRMAAAFVVIAAAEGAVALLNKLTGAAEKQQKAFDQTAASLAGYRAGTNDATVVTEKFFQSVKSEVDRIRGPIEGLKETFTFRNWGKDIETGIKVPFGTLKADIEDVDAAFKKFLQASPQAAMDLVAAMKVHAATLDVNSRAYKDLNLIIGRYEAQVNLAKAATQGLTGATEDLNEEVRTTLSLQDVVRNAQNAVTQSKFDDLRMNNANAESLKQFQREVYGMSGSTSKATKTIADAIDNYRKAIEGNISAQESLRNASQRLVDSQQKVADAAHQITQAQRNVTKANRDVTAAIQGVADAQAKTAGARTAYRRSIDETAKAQANLTKASQDVAKAQDALNAALRGYGASSQQGLDAQRKLGESQRDAQRASFDAEKAVFRIADAEAELAKVREKAESTPQDIREAEIALAEAKLALIDTQLKEIDAQDDATKAADHYNQMLNGVNETSSIYKTLLDDLNSAKAAEERAINAVTTAREAEVKALEAIQNALDGEAQAAQRVEDAKWALVEAERAVERAKRDEAAAIRDVAKATLDEAQAILEAAKAQRELNAARNKAPAPAVARIDAQFANVTSMLNAAKAEQDTATANEAYSLAAGYGLQFFAKGGIVTQPTLGIVGERGPEAVIPLSSPHAPGLGTTINVTVNAGMGADGDAVGKAVVDALRQYQRHNGAIPITVA